MSQGFGYARFTGDTGDHDEARNSQDEELDAVCTRVSEDVTRIKSNVSSFEKLLLLLGTPREPASLRSQIGSTQQHTSVLIKSVNDQFRIAADLRRESRDRNVQFRLDRLQADFKTVLQSYQKLQRDILEKLKATQNSANAASAAQSVGSYGSIESQTLATSPSGGPRQISAQLAHEDELIVTQQRESDLVRLEQDMVAVHEIFKDLSTMVYEQGAVVDSIEGHVEHASVHVEQGQEQLAHAVQHKRSYRRNCCILWTIIAVVVGIIILVLILHFSGK